MYVESAVLDLRAPACFSVCFLITKITETVFGCELLAQTIQCWNV